jgi:polyketide synthase PksJ
VGGIGLTLAAYLARTVQAKLVLTSRSALPLADPRHAQVAALTALGAEVLVLSADVTDPVAMADVVATTLARFGALHGVIHAAGVAGGGLIQGQTAASVAAVLAPKVTGTQVLHAVTQELALDFLVLCSSLTALTGGLGQMAYCAANAFLDAFAQQHAQANQATVVALNWDRWQGVGMAVAAAAALGLPVETGTPVHPLLGTCVLATPTQVAYRVALSPASHWVLAEHQVVGTPTLPGTAYLEMARAALAHLAPDRPCELSDVVFLTPLMIKQGEQKNVLTLLQKNGENYSFHIVSQSLEVDGKSRWQEHARGQIGFAPQVADTRHDVAALLSNYQQVDLAERMSMSSNGKTQFMEWGPRWNTVKSAYQESNGGLAFLELPEEFSSDVAAYALHPALLDIGTNAVGSVRRGSYLALAYQKLTIRGPLPSKIYSRVKHTDMTRPDQELITSNVTFMDESGLELVNIEGFTLKRVNGNAAANVKSLFDSQNSADLGAQPLTTDQERFFDQLLASGSQAQQEAILPEEGAEVFERILNQHLPPQIVISVQDLQTKIEQSATATGSSILAELQIIDRMKPRHARPDMNSPYVPPDNEVERTIAEVWQRVLGIEHVGIHDNFFELGGTSLVGLQLVAELKQALGIDVPVVSIFEAPTIHALSKQLDIKQDRNDPFQQDTSRAQKKKEAFTRQKEQMRRRSE